MASAASRQPHTPAAASSAGTAGASPGTQPAVDVTAITTRDDFLLELGQALGGQASIRPVDSLEAALEVLGGPARRGQVVVLDATQTGEARPTADALEGRAPQAVLLVFAPEALERQVAAAVKGSRVFAVLSSPIDARKAQAVFGAVIEEAAARRTAGHGAAQAAAPVVEFTPGPPQSEPLVSEEPPRQPGGRSRLPLIALAAVAALAVAGGAAWFLTRGAPGPPAGGAPAAPQAQATTAAPAAAATAEAAPGSSAAALPAAPGADVSIVHGKVDELLEKARLAMRERRYTDPAGDNALVYYRSAVAANSANAEARDGLQRIAGLIAGRFEEALTAGRLDEAAQNFANFRAAVPDDPRVAELGTRLANAQINRAVADGNLERATALVRQAQQSGTLNAEQAARWRADLGKRQEEAKIQRLVALVEGRIREGKLVDPADDSARFYVRSLMTSAPNSPSTQRAGHDLTTAYLRKAREAAFARNSAEEDRWLNEARAVGMSAADISAFKSDIAAGRAKAAQAEGERLAQLARERVRDGRLTDPAQDSAAWYLTQLQSTDPQNAALGAVSHDLAKLLLERARATLQAGKNADADIAAARRFGADPRDVQAVQQAGAPRAGAVDPATLAAGLKAVKTVPPDYPQKALAEGVSGSVLLTFTVDARGATRDVQVLQSTPHGVFDRAAVAAVKRWRYEPMIVNGAPVEVPTRTLVRFELPKQ